MTETWRGDGILLCHHREVRTAFLLILMKKFKIHMNNGVAGVVNKS